jgi:hypothetical protein
MKGSFYFALLVVALCTFTQESPQGSGVRVPDAAAALKIAEPILVKTYGTNLIDYEQPFAARLVRGVWIINGTLCCPDTSGRRTCKPFACAGGVAVLKLRQQDGKVVSITHGK